jgi:GDPmannose 4,6-dehydratase
MTSFKKVIVTGATGQDGSYMIEYLLKNTDNTIVAAIRRTSQAILNNLKNVIDNPRVKFVTVDLCDGEAVRGLVREEKPDYFINFGAQSFVADSWKNPTSHMQTNAISLIHILEAIREYVPSCRFYSAGSSEQWGDVKYSPQDEKHPMSPRSIYGVSKCAASHIVKIYRESYNLYAIHGILLNHESERRQEYFLTRKVTKGVARIKAAFCQLNFNFDPIELGNIDAYRDWSHAEDFIEGVWMMLNQEVYRQDLQPELYREGSYNKTLISPLKEYVLASNETHTVREFIEKAFAVAGIKGIWYQGFAGKPESEEYLLSGDGLVATKSKVTLVKINPKFYRPADVELLHGSSALVRKELGWSPKNSFDDLVSRMVKNDLSEVGL